MACDWIELRSDHFFDDVPRKFRCAGEGLKPCYAPSFVFMAIIPRSTDRECRHLVEEEIKPVVVVKDHSDVRFVLC